MFIYKNRDIVQKFVRIVNRKYSAYTYLLCSGIIIDLSLVYSILQICILNKIPNLIIFTDHVMSEALMFHLHTKHWAWSNDWQSYLLPKKNIWQ